MSLQSEIAAISPPSSIQTFCFSLQCRVAFLSRRAPDVNPHLNAAPHEDPSQRTTVLNFAKSSPTKSVDLDPNRSVSTRVSTKRRTLNNKRGIHLSAGGQ
jgi:hypothetical protein